MKHRNMYIFVFLCDCICDYLPIQYLTIQYSYLFHGIKRDFILSYAIYKDNLLAPLVYLVVLNVICGLSEFNALRFIK